MYLIPPTEKLIETKICRHCSISFPITDKDMEFYKKVSPTFGGKKYSIPTPTLCPDCRQQRRESVKNIHCLYKYENTGIVSTYSPDKGLFVLTQKTWWEDNSLGMQFGRDYDFSRQFFEQFHELQKVAPRWNLIQIFSENCEWCINTSDSKNSYFIKSGKNAENCFYGERVFSSKNIIDGYRILNSDSCYDSWFLADCYQVFWSYKTRFSQNSLFLFECDNVTFCLGCTGLRHKTYHILNMPVTEKEYHECRKNILTSRSFRDEFKNKFVDLYMKTPRKNLDTFESENFNGDEIFNSKNAKCSFSVRDSEDIAYAYDGSFAKSCMDVNAPDEQELCYETSSNYKLHHDVFCFNSIYLNRCFYVETCANLNDCFGCVGLNHKSYCILNKQYTKEEYEVLVPKIIEHMMKTGEWGEFFPSSLSPFGYNETVAMEYFPLSREAVLGEAPFGKELSEVKRKTEDFQKIETENPSPAIAGTPFQKGAYFNWSDYEAPFPKVEKIIKASMLPDDISKIPDDILNWAIECEVTKKPFRIIKQELEFYRKHNLPIPRRHPDQRHLDRMALRNPRKLFERKCDKCGKDMITSYSPEREEIVYCEECYNKEVIG